MKILFVTAEPHPSFRADVRVLFGKYLPRLGVHSDLVTLPGCETPPPWPGGRWLPAPRPRNRWHKQWLQLRLDLALFALARRGYDALQVRDRVLAGCFGLLAARRAGIPFYYWASYPKPEFRCHAAREQGLRGGALKWLANALRGRLSAWLLYRIVLPRADHVFVQSEAMKTAFARRGIAPARMSAVPMGVDLDEAAAALAEPEGAGAEPRPPEGARVLVYVGAMERIRQPELLLQAMPSVLSRHPRAVLRMVGDSHVHGDLDALKRRVVGLGIGASVQFTGWVSSMQALVEAGRAEVGLSVFPRGPVLDVASPTKVPEYLAMGVPVVANDSPDQAHVIAASGGGLCVSLDPEAYAQAICRLLDDPAAARALGRSGSDYVRRERSYERIANDVARAYRAQLDRAQTVVGR